MTRPSILEFFPGIPRQVQTDTLLAVEKEWDSTDVFVLRLPVASGKSKLSVAIQRWSGSAAILTPTNVLQEQYSNEFPYIATLKKKEANVCGRYKSNCASVKRASGSQCKNCDYIKTVIKAKKGRNGVFNFYIYMAHKLFKPTIIIDEAHQMIGMLQTLAARKVWKHEYDYPEGLETVGDLVSWLETQPASKKLARLKADLTSLKPSTVVEKTEDYYKGEYKEVLKLIPLDTRNEPPILWPPNKVNKIILMSATFSDGDLVQTGLSNRRVTIIDGDSPIPAVNRPVISELVVGMGRAGRAENLPLVVTRVMEIVDHHAGEKGIIHVPYSLIPPLRAAFGDDPRYMFHNRSNKGDQYDKFRDTPPDSGTVLVSAGLTEGIDLVGDSGRFQIIMKVPYVDLGDTGVAAKAAEDPDWYSWSAIKTILQASGRICRTPTDSGVTYILDSNFKRLYNENVGMFPAWFSESLIRRW